MKDDDLLVVVGSNKLNFGGVAYQSKKLIHHPDFSMQGVLNDVGLILVNDTIQFNDNVRAIDLPNENVNVDGYPAVVAGWGKLEVSKYFFLLS